MSHDRDQPTQDAFDPTSPCEPRRATHEPVLLRETLELLAPKPGHVLVDGTAGGGGAMEALLRAVAPGGKVVGIDRDPEAIERCRDRFSTWGEAAALVHGDFRHIARQLAELDLARVDGVLLDLGLSSLQLAEGAGRGFSFTHDEELDMRMTSGSGESARDLIARLNEDELSALLRDYGEEPHHRRIARAICEARTTTSITRTRQLADIIAKAVPRGGGRRLHPATRSFMALRIVTNDELRALEAALPQVRDILSPRGRMVVISYHSLEDRRVKQFIRDEARGCICPPRQPVCSCGLAPTLRPVGQRPVRPAPDEVSRNPRSRSARLRCAERLETERVLRTQEESGAP